MNEFEQLIVIEEMRKMGIEHYNMQPGNGCIWVSYRVGSSQLHSYYIFRNGKLIDVQYDWCCFKTTPKNWAIWPENQDLL